MHADAGDLPQPLDRPSAQRFCGDLGETVDTLIRVLDEETRLVRAARLDEAAALAAGKSEVAERYMRAHTVLRAHGAEIGRLAPVEVAHLRGRHDALDTAMRVNMAVLATARTVSETLVNGIADCVHADKRRPATYDAGARTDNAARPARPLGINVAL